MDDREKQQTRVVITGIGVVCSAGQTAREFWETLTRPRTDAEDFGAPVAPDGTSHRGVTDFTGKIEDFGQVRGTRRRSLAKAIKLMNRETQMGVSAGLQALCDSDAVEHYAPERFGVCFGADNVSLIPEDFAPGVQACSTSDGSLDEGRWGDLGIDEVAPLWLLRCLPNMPACHLAIISDLQGPGNTITQRDIAGNMAIAEACRNIRASAADAFLVGATGTTLTPFNAMHAELEDDVASCNGVCRPFDRQRTGAVAAEGAAAIVVEKLATAVERGARIYGEIRGFGAASAVGSERISVCRKALVRAMRQTLRHSGQSADTIGHVHAHGLGSHDSDIAESQALFDVFGDRAADVPIVAASSCFGNAGSASGLLELVASLMAMERGHLFPIRTFREADSECRLRLMTSCSEPAGASFLNLSLFGRGPASCTAVGAFCA